jgi:hypothetical protein
MLVPSRATMRVKTHREVNARMSRVLGFHASAGGGCSGFVDDNEVDELETGRGVGSSCAFVTSGGGSLAISKGLCWKKGRIHCLFHCLWL